MLILTTTSIGATIFDICIVPLLLLVSAFLVTWINAKRKEALAKTDNEVAQKFINIAADVINSCVITTTETYVKSMKNQNMFVMKKHNIQLLIKQKQQSWIHYQMKPKLIYHHYMAILTNTFKIKLRRL